MGGKGKRVHRKRLHLFFTFVYCCWYENHRKLNDRLNKIIIQPNNMDNYFCKTIKTEIADGGQIIEQRFTHPGDVKSSCEPMTAPNLEQLAKPPQAAHVLSKIYFTDQKHLHTLLRLGHINHCLHLHFSNIVPSLSRCFVSRVMHLVQDGHISSVWIWQLENINGKRRHSNQR